ncbi:MAG: hypothetical protein ACK2UY_07705 [Anaerolineae bacterium]
MIKRNEQTCARSRPLRWACPAPVLATVVLAAVVLAALVGTVAAGSRPAQPEPAAPKQAMRQTTPGGSSQISGTVFLPVMQRCVPLDSVGLAGPETGTIGLTQTLTAMVSTASSRLPVTYTWWVGSQPAVVHAGGLEDVIEIRLERTGAYPVTVEATNGCGVVRAERVLTLTTRGLVAFERHYAAEEPHDIWLLDSAGSGMELNLTNTPDIDEGAPTWSPDGNWLAYSAGTPGSKRAIYKMDLSSGQVTALTDGSRDDRWPDWSPTGDRIAFMRNLPDLAPNQYYPDIWVMDTDGGSQQQLTDWLWQDDFPSWSPDGLWIAFTTDRDFNGRDLWKLEADNPTHLVRLTTTARPNPEQDERDEIYPSWSPDGWVYHTFVYSNNEHDESELLYRVRDDGSSREQVFNDAYNRYIPSFSPDGSCFVFYSFLGGGDKEVWKWCDGYTAALNLTDNEAGDEFCAWSPVSQGSTHIP